MVARRTQLKAQQGMAQFCTIPWIGDSNEMQEEKNIEMIVYRLVKKDEYQYQIKKDRKVVNRITKAGGGWYSCSLIFSIVDKAVNYWVGLKEKTSAEFGEDIKMKVVGK